MENHPNNIEHLTNGIKTLSASPPPTTTSNPRSLAPSTLAIHADDTLHTTPDVSPAIHVSTTFRYTSDPSQLIPEKDQPAPTPSDAHVYSRHTSPTPTRLECILTPLLHAPAITYTSGLSALHAAYVFLKPRRVAIGGGYHGSHGVLRLHSKLTGATILPLDCAAEELEAGDVIHLETPVNPTGEALSIAKYADKAHARGAVLLVDSTFAPPGLQEPFGLGADVVMHSGTKYLGGHSDMLCGVLATRDEEWVKGLREERVFLGSVMGNLESWLGVRSLRTLEVRVRAQSEGAEGIVGWLDGMMRGEGDEGVGGKGVEEGRAVKGTVERVWHASLQTGDIRRGAGWLGVQMPNGYGPVFAITMRTEGMARRLPSNLELFHHATSLGGVESLIEWRAMSDESVDPRLVRVSVGIERWQDLKEDLGRGFKALLEEEVEGKE